MKMYKHKLVFCIEYITKHKEYAYALSDIEGGLSRTLHNRFEGAFGDGQVVIQTEEIEV